MDKHRFIHDSNGDRIRLLETLKETVQLVLSPFFYELDTQKHQEATYQALLSLFLFNKKRFCKFSLACRWFLLSSGQTIFLAWFVPSQP
jgi:hypothetical protein